MPLCLQRFQKLDFVENSLPNAPIGLIECCSMLISIVKFRSLLATIFVLDPLSVSKLVF